MSWTPEYKKKHKCDNLVTKNENSICITRTRTTKQEEGINNWMRGIERARIQNWRKVFTDFLKRV